MAKFQCHWAPQGGERPGWASHPVEPEARNAPRPSPTKAGASTGKEVELETLTPPEKVAAPKATRTKDEQAKTNKRKADMDADDDERKAAKKELDGAFRKMKTMKDAYNIAMASCHGLVSSIESESSWRWAQGVDLEELTTAKDVVITCVHRSSFWSAWATYDNAFLRKDLAQQSPRAPFASNSWASQVFLILMLLSCFMCYVRLYCFCVWFLNNKT